MLGAMGLLCWRPAARLASLADRRSAFVGAATTAPTKLRRLIAWTILMIVELTCCLLDAGIGWVC